MIICDIVSEIDVSVSGAILNKYHKYSKPTIVNDKSDESYILSKELRHPIIEVINDEEEYVPNDISIGKDNKCMLLFGLNSAGKSSLLRAIGCNIILAQMGMYTSSETFEYKPYKKLLTKIK